jgi:hypothetical protein
MISTARSTFLSALAMSAGIYAWGSQSLATSGESTTFPYRAQVAGPVSATGCVVQGVRQVRPDARPWVQVKRY